MDVLGRKPLSPAFRMAILAGAMESVRLHLRSGSDINATDDKGRSPLILAASRGRLDLCQLLLKEGADPDIRDHEGNDALAVARLRGQQEIAVLLAGAVPDAEDFSPAGIREDGYGTVTGVERTVPSGSNVIPFSAPAAEEISAETGGQDSLGPWLSPDDEDAFDLAAWQEEAETSPPPDDTSCANGAVFLQNLISRHVPIDRDVDWDDVEIDLPEIRDLVQRRASLTEGDLTTLRLILVEALRDGRVRGERIASCLLDKDDADDTDKALLRKSRLRHERPFFRRPHQPLQRARHRRNRPRGMTPTEKGAFMPQA